MRAPGPCMLLTSICFALALIFAYSRCCISVVHSTVHLFHRNGDDFEKHCIKVDLTFLNNCQLLLFVFVCTTALVS